MIEKNKIRLGDCIVVNYHYVRDHSNKFPGINSCPVKEFDRQINFLSNNYKIVSVPEVFNSAKNNLKGKFCALSFDDCLRDVYSNVRPILKKYRAEAAIFLIASVLEGKLPSIHKLHILLSKFSAGELIGEFNKMQKNGRPISKTRRMYKNKRLDDDILTANLKETLTVIPPCVKDNFINSIFKKLNLNEAALIKYLFMNADEIKELCGAGFTLGNHSYNHNNLAGFGVIDIRADMKKSKKVISDFFGSVGESEIFSYPSGRWNRDVLKVLKEEGFKYALTTKEKSVSRADSALLIPRCDANNISDFLDAKKYV